MTKDRFQQRIILWSKDPRNAYVNVLNIHQSVLTVTSVQSQFKHNTQLPERHYYNISKLRENFFVERHQLR